MQNKLLILFLPLTLQSSVRAMDNIDRENSSIFEQCRAAIERHNLTLFKNSFSQIKKTNDEETIIERLKEVALASKAKTLFYTPTLYREKKLEKWLCRGIIFSGYLLYFYELFKPTNFFDFPKHPLREIQNMWLVSLLGKTISELQQDIKHCQNPQQRIQQKQKDAETILNLFRDAN